MFGKLSTRFRILIAVILIGTYSHTPLTVNGQDLISFNSFGGSSVFVFRSAAKSRRFSQAAKPSRTKVQRLATVSKLKTQYETLAMANPRKLKAIDPSQAVTTLGPVEGSKRLAGIGEYYRQKGDIEQALERYREAVSLDSKNLGAKTGLSEVLALKGNNLLLDDKGADAKAVFLEALTFDEKNSAAYFGLGEVYADLNEFAEAIAYYEKSLAADAKLTEIYVPLGILYYQTGEIAKADDFLTKALAISAESSETQFFLGLVRSAQNRNDEALTALLKAKQLDPADPEILHSLGELLSKLKRPADAVPEYQKAVEYRPTYFDAWLGLAQAQYAAGNFTEALPSFQTAARLRSDSWEAKAGLGETLLKTGKFGEAIGQLTPAVDRLVQTKEFDKNTAADLYSKIAFANGTQCEINMKLAKPCYWNAAVRNLQKAVDLTSDPLDYGNLGWALFNAARIDAADKTTLPDSQAKLVLAKTALEKAMTGNDTVREGAAGNLANVLIDLGDYPAAIELLKTKLVKTPDSSFSQYALASAYLRSNDFDNAAKWYRSVLEKEPNFVNAIKNLGIAEVRRKNGKEARKLLERLKPLSRLDAIALENELKVARL